MNIDQAVRKDFRDKTQQLRDWMEHRDRLRTHDPGVIRRRDLTRQIVGDDGMRELDRQELLDAAGRIIRGDGYFWLTAPFDPVVS